MRYAIEDINSFLVSKPNLTFIYLVRGYLYLGINRYQEAANDLTTFLVEFEGDEKWKDRARDLLSRLKEKVNVEK